MKNIYDVLKQKEAEYATIFSEYRRMSDIVNKLSREIDAIRTTVKLLGDAQDQGTEVGQKELSQPQMVRAVLVEKGEEMHLAEIIKAVKNKFNKELTPNVIAAVLFRYSKRGSVFYKAAKPNTWGLLEFRGTTTPISIMAVGERVA